MQTVLAKTSVRTPVASRAAAKNARTVVVRAQQDSGVDTLGKAVLATAAAVTVGLSAGAADAFPIFAQGAYANPREANGRIVCANCHLAQKPVDLELPQAVLPDSVFEATVKIPYDKSIQQVQGSGKKGGLQVGMVLILPEGFTLAPADRVPEEMKEKQNGLTYTPYSDKYDNIFVIGPIDGEKNSEMHIPILSPDPAKNKSVNFLKYSFYVGGNRGRGQVYPDGSKSNNTVWTASKPGTITAIDVGKKKTLVSITTDSGDVVEDKIPAGPELLVAVGDVVKQDQPLTNNPNVGGFGQEEKEVVLQDPNRILGMFAFFFGSLTTQVALVLKKKQFEKVQLAEMNF